MKKTKKALLAALACSAVLAGALGFAACKGGNDDGGATPQHSHNYTWTSNNNGTHNGTCADTDGKCDAKNVTNQTCDELGKDGVDGACSRCGYKAEEDDPTKITVGDKTIESLDTTGVTLTFEGLEAGKEYTLSSTNDKVNFGVGILQGNPVTFEYSPTATYTVNVNSTEGTLTNVVIKLEEADNGGGGDENDYTTLELDTEVTVTGASMLAPKFYQITIAETGEYQALSDGMPIPSGVIFIGAEVGEDGYVVPIDPDKNNAYALEAGTYYVEVDEDLTFKIATSIGHVHTVDTTSWTSDSKGHWHPLTCYDAMTAKSEVEKHQFGEWSEADEDGVKTKTCSVCDYKEMQVDGTAITGGRTDTAAVEVPAAGVYTVTIKTAMVEGHLTVAEQYFKLVGGSTAKKYTVKILTSNTTISPDMAGYDSFSEVGGTFEIVLGEGDTALFNIASNDEEVQTGYTCNVAFKVTESEAPAEGDILRPIKVADGEEAGKTVTEGEEVYFAIKYSDFKSAVSVTFGEGVTVYSLGLNKNNNKTPIESGYIISANDYSGATYYLCATSTGADCKITVSKDSVAGSKDKPKVATFGTDNPNSATLTMENKEQWFKLESATGGKFTLTASDGDAVLETYTEIPKVSSSFYTGSNIITVELEANVPLYIRALHWNNMGYTFTVTEFVAGAQDGKTAETAFVITESGEFTIPEEFHYVDAEFYLNFKVEQDSTVTISYIEAETNATGTVISGNRVYLIIDDSWVGASANPKTIDVSAGSGQLVKVCVDSVTDAKLTITITPKA